MTAPHPGGINHGAAARRVAAKVLSENAVAIAVAALACLYNLLAFDWVDARAPRTARAASIVSTVASAGLCLLYAMMFIVMTRLTGPY
ncbi:MAG: hypothetical protein AB1918_05545 [Pseudomonadota bacterium]